MEDRLLLCTRLVVAIWPLSSHDTICFCHLRAHYCSALLCLVCRWFVGSGTLHNLCPLSMIAFPVGSSMALEDMVYEALATRSSEQCSRPRREKHGT